MESPGISFIGLLALLLVLVFLSCLLIAAIDAVVRVGKRYGALAAIGLAIGLMAVPLVLVSSIFFLSFNSVKMASSAAEESGSASVNFASVNPLPDTPSSGWLSATELGEFKASLYPGIVECADPITFEIREVLGHKEFEVEFDETSEGEGIQFLVRMEDNLRYETDQFANTFVQSLRARFPRANLIQRSVVRDKPMKLKSDEVSLTLSMEVEDIGVGLLGADHQSRSGTVACQIETESNSGEVKLQFTEKPWVTRLDEVVSRFPNKQLVIGYSSELASSESQARRSALENVRMQVEVRNQNGSRILIADEHVVDRFAQKLSRSYGNVWREAVLVDLTGDEIRWTAAATMANAGRRKAMSRFTALSAVLLVLAAVIVCFIANVMTQGYYRTPIRRGTVTAIVLVVLGGLLFLGLTIT